MVKDLIIHTGTSRLNGYEVVEILPIDKNVVKVKIYSKNIVTYYFRVGDKFIVAETNKNTSKKIFFYNTFNELQVKCKEIGIELKTMMDDYIAEVISFDFNKLVLRCNYPYWNNVEEGHLLGYLATYEVFFE